MKPEQEDADDGEVSDEDEAAEVDTSRLEQEKKATKTAGAVANGTSTEGVASDPVANGTTTEGEPEGKKEGEGEGKKEGEGEVVAAGEGGSTEASAEKVECV